MTRAWFLRVDADDASAVLMGHAWQHRRRVNEARRSNDQKAVKWALAVVRVRVGFSP
jgi:hypothetical protein